MTIQLTFKQSGGESFDITFSEPSTSISDVKKIAAEKSGIPAESQRLIYKGRILKDTDSLSSLKVESGHTFHLVKGGASAAPAPAPAAAPVPQPAAAPTRTRSPPRPTPVAPQSSAFPTATQHTQPNAFGGGAHAGRGAHAAMGGMDPAAMMQMMGGGGGGGLPSGVNPQMAMQMMQNPMMQQMMQQMSQNPEMLRMMIESNPMMRQMMQSNPMMAQMLQNPEMLRLLFNPQFMQGMMQMQAAMAGMGMQPQMGMGGMGASPSSQGGSDAGHQPDYEAMLQQLQGNPMLAAALGGAGAGAGDLSAPIPETERAQLESQYASQLEQLSGMGFGNREANINALRMTAGNVEAAINLLFDFGN